MTPADSLAQYLQENLFRTFADNRKILEADWERNKYAYDMTGDSIPQKVGVGNKKSKKDKKDWRSKSVSDLTRIKTNAGRILVCDVLLANGKIPFKLKEQKINNTLIGTVLNRFSEGSSVPIAPAGTADSSPAEIDLPADTVPSADPITLMNELLQEQFVEAKADIALKKCVQDAAIYGEGITRIYSGTTRKNIFSNTPQGWMEQQVEQECLQMRSVSIWDFFTDLEDHDIRNNLGVFERRIMSYQDVLRNFANEDDEYNVEGAVRSLAHKINEEDEHGSIRDNESPHIRDINKRKKNLEVLEFFGRVPARYVQALKEQDVPASEDLSNRSDVEIMAVVVENTLVRFALSEPSMRPFVRITWEEPSDNLRGTGIADSCAPAQQSLDSILRLIEDNKKLTCNATFAKKSIFFANQHDNEGFYPGKEIEIDASCDDVRKAIQQIVFQDVGQSGFDLLNFYRQSGNESSMIPEIAHGISPSSATTAYEVSIRNEKAGKYISDVVKGIDNHWIEPVSMFFYRWNMYNPEIPENFKGCFSVEPMGFASYNDRVLRMNVLKEMLSMSLSNPLLSQSVNIHALLAEWMKSNDLDPAEFISAGQNSFSDPVFAQIQEKIQQLENIVSELMQHLPDLAGRSELDAAEQEARIAKLQAEARKITESVPLELEKERTRRAQLISSMEKQVPEPVPEGESYGRNTQQ